VDHWRDGLCASTTKRTWRARPCLAEDDKAIADFNEAIRVDPKSAEAYGGRGAAWSALYSDPEDKKNGDARVKLYRDKKPYRED
jgi:hypothetical protein